MLTRFQDNGGIVIFLDENRHDLEDNGSVTSNTFFVGNTSSLQENKIGGENARGY
jgi:hypothetical protein